MKYLSSTHLNLFLLLSLALSFPLIAPNLAIAAPGEKSGPPPLVTIISVTEQQVNPQTEYVGHVEAVQTVELQARVSGFLEEIHFQEGSDVKAGQALYLVEPAPYRLQVAVNQARVAKAQAKSQDAGQRLQRIKTVMAGGIPITDIEAAEAAARQAQAELSEAQAILKLSELDLHYTRITAPISGRIGATSLTIGNLCGPGSGPLAQIVQLDPIRVLFSIGENEITALKAAQTDAAHQKGPGIMQPRISLADGNFLKNPGRIDFVDNRVDTTTGTIAVRALFDNPEGRLLPGQYVRLLASQSPKKMLPVIPQAAVLEDRDGRYVLVVNRQQQVEQRRITTGAALGSLWAVETGLSAGEQLIVQGLQKVRPGQLVTTTRVDAAQGS